MDVFQKAVTSKLNEILTDKQRKQITDMENMFAGGPPGFGGPGFGGPGFGPPGGGPGFGPPGFGPLGPDGGGPGRPGRGGPGGRGGGPGGPGSGPGGIFRAYKYAADYVGLKDKVLTPGKKLAEVAAVAPPSGPGAPGPGAK